MTNRELNELLKKSPVPARPAEYWEDFPRRVLAATRCRKSASAPERYQGGWSRYLFRAMAYGGAVACLLLVAVLVHRSTPAPRSDSLVEMQTILREIQALFPNQVRAIVLDTKGAHLELADSPDIPPSAPVVLKFSGPKGPTRFITFSGQTIDLNGAVAEVLLDHLGNVLLVGKTAVWSSASPHNTFAGQRVEAATIRSM